MCSLTGSVEHVEPVVDVLGGVAVHDVEHHVDPHPVRLVHQVLQVLGGAVPSG